jgi:hypothetical protein
MAGTSVALGTAEFIEKACEVTGATAQAEVTELKNTGCGSRDNGGYVSFRSRFIIAHHLPKIIRYHFFVNR